MSAETNRIIILDTELTDTNLTDGGRIIALGLVEVFDKVRIGEGREWFFNPEGRVIPPESFRIHGLSPEFLADKPCFSSCIDDITAFIGDSSIVHHCWTYKENDKDTDFSVDEMFVRKEFERAGRSPVPHSRWINMKSTARKIDPDRNSLNDMLDRFGIDRTERDKNHGALLDARLTALLYTAYAQRGYY